MLVKHRFVQSMSRKGVNISGCGDSAENRRLLSGQGTPRVLVCLAGEGQLEHDGADYRFR